MNKTLRTAAVAFALAAAAVAPATAAPYSQLAASAGLSPSEAAGMSLSQIAAAFFNRGESLQDRQTIRNVGADVSTANTSNLAGGLRLSARDQAWLSPREIAAAHYNRGQSASDQITVMTPTPGMGSDRVQLAAAAGLGIDGADGRSLTEIAGHFFNQGESTADKQLIRN